MLTIADEEVTKKRLIHYPRSIIHDNREIEEHDDE